MSMSSHGQTVVADVADYYVAQYWFGPGEDQRMVAARQVAVATGQKAVVVLTAQQQAKLLHFMKEHKDPTMRQTAKALAYYSGLRAKATVESDKRYVNVFGGTKEEVYICLPKR